MVLVLLGGGGFYGIQWIIKNTCSGSVTATIVASPRTAELLNALATEWGGTKPQVNGICVGVQIRSQEAAVTAQALTQRWDTTQSGPEPDVWVPPSSAWARAAAANSDIADKLLPDRLPSVARTPVVIAMPKQLAESFGWPNSELDWKDLLDKLAADGNIKIGMSDPATSTAGLLALSSIIDANDDADVDPTEIQRVFTFEQRVSVLKTTTDELFSEYVTGNGQTLNAFPALEQDVVKHNEANPSLPLVAVYPKNATTEADHPYLKLDAPWTSHERQSAASEFLSYVQGESGRDAVMAGGFRDSNRVPGPMLTPEKGVVAKLTALPRAVLLADAIAKTVSTWNALTRPTNVLLVLDVSGSMRQQVPGVGTRMELTKAAATQAVGMLDNESQMGLWVFSSGQPPHRELVKPGKLSEDDRRKRLTDELAKLTAGGNTGMYDTVWAAFQAVQAGYVPNAENLVVVLTDGADDDQLQGLKLSELTERLKGADKSKPVKVVTIALGRDTESEALADISAATGVRSYKSLSAHDISQVLVSAIFDVKV